MKAIIGRRPSTSNSRPSSSGPRKLPAANGRMYQPTWLGRDAVEIGQHQRVGEEDRVVEERLRGHQREPDQRAPRDGDEQRVRHLAPAACARARAAAPAAVRLPAACVPRASTLRSMPATTRSASAARPCVISQRGLSGSHSRMKKIDQRQRRADEECKRASRVPDRSAPDRAARSRRARRAPRRSRSCR